MCRLSFIRAARDSGFDGIRDKLWCFVRPSPARTQTTVRVKVASIKDVRQVYIGHNKYLHLVIEPKAFRRDLAQSMRNRSPSDSAYAVPPGIDTTYLFAHFTTASSSLPSSWGPSCRLPPLAFNLSTPPHPSYPSYRKTLKPKPCLTWLYIKIYRWSTDTPDRDLRRLLLFAKESATHLPNNHKTSRMTTTSRLRLQSSGGRVKPPVTFHSQVTQYGEYRCTQSWGLDCNVRESCPGSTPTHLQLYGFKEHRCSKKGCMVS